MDVNPPCRHKTQAQRCKLTCVCAHHGLTPEPRLMARGAPHPSGRDSWCPGGKE